MASAVLRDAAPHTDLHPIHGHGFATDDEEDELEPETYKFVWYGPEHAIKKLQQYEHGVDTVNDLGWTTLMWAALEGAADVVEALLSEGANPFVASAVAWQPPGRRFAFPVGITALDLCQIALTDGVADVQETDGGHGHLWILRRLAKLFKVAELQAVRDVSNIDPYTNDYNHSRLPLTAHQSVVHITDSNYRERPYAASFAREGDTGLVFGIRGGRIVVADIVPGSAASEIAAQDELAYVHGGYCHPRPPYMRKGLELSRINGQDVSQWGDLQMIQLLAAGYGSRDAELALQEAGRVVHAPGVLQEAAGEQGGDGEAAPLVAGSSLLDSIGSTIGSIFIDADTEAEKEAAKEAAQRKERNEMMDLATEFLKSKGMHAVRPVKFDFVAPKSAYLSGWMEGADAARAMDASKGGDPELGLMFAQYDPSTATPEKPRGVKQFYACGGVLSSAVTLMREKLDPKQPWDIQSNTSSAEGFNAVAVPPAGHAPPSSNAPPQCCTKLYCDSDAAGPDELTVEAFKALLAAGTVDDGTLVYSDEALFTAVFTDWTPWNACSYLFVAN